MNGMDPVQPNLDWYLSRREQGAAPRCPFASVHRCPRYYASLWIVGECGGATKIDPQQDQELFERWKNSDLRPATREQDTGARGSEDRKPFYNLCPEVGFERFGWFATFFAPYVDEIDIENAHRRLSTRFHNYGDVFR
jgi:hypothetical protein